MIILRRWRGSDFRVTEREGWITRVPTELASEVYSWQESFLFVVIFTLVLISRQLLVLRSNYFLSSIKRALCLLTVKRVQSAYSALLDFPITVWIASNMLFNQGRGGGEVTLLFSTYVSWPTPPASMTSGKSLGSLVQISKRVRQLFGLARSRKS